MCQDFALFAKRENLPQSFWRSRFELGHEQDYLCPDFSTKRNWFRLFCDAQSCLREGNLSLINRKRIWTLLQPIADLVVLDCLRSRQPHGISISMDSDTKQYRVLDNDQLNKFSTKLATFSSFSGELASESYHNQLTEGCRVKHHRLTRLFRKTLQKSQYITVSTVKLGSQHYISGFKCSDNLFELGFDIPNSKSVIEIPETTKIEAIEVAFCKTGLVGIGFLFSGSEESQWTGQSNGHRVVRGILKLSEISKTYYVVACLDVSFS